MFIILSNPKQWSHWPTELNSCFNFHTYWFNWLFVLLFSVSLHFHQCVSTAQIEIDSLFIMAWVNSTDWLSGWLISFCNPPMQLRINCFFYANTPRNTQFHTWRYNIFRWPKVYDALWICAFSLLGVCGKKKMHTHNLILRNTQWLVVLLTGHCYKGNVFTHKTIG